MLIYLASPYSHSEAKVRKARFGEACRAAGRLMAQGYFIFSPIAHTHPIAVRCELPKDFEFWKEFDEAMMDVCDEVWVLTIDGWKESVGVTAEINYAKRMAIPIKYTKGE